MKRREFITTTVGMTLAAGAAFSTQPTAWAAEKTGSDPFLQPPLPYPLNALAPFLSEEQMSYHYGKHHAGYFKKLSELLEGKPDGKKSLEELIVTTSGPVFNNAAQAWNHTFFWNCMTPKKEKGPQGKLAAAIERDFGDFAKFQDQFKNTAVSLFGSGWAWLAKNPDGKLEILPGSNADTPLKVGKKPILVVDVWEHAYYVDYRNERAKFVAEFLEHVNWPFAEKQFEEA